MLRPGETTALKLLTLLEVPGFNSAASGLRWLVLSSGSRELRQIDPQQERWVGWGTKLVQYRKVQSLQH